jgi:polar amino acid transport system substrate-binding protein
MRAMQRLFFPLLQTLVREVASVAASERTDPMAKTSWCGFNNALVLLAALICANPANAQQPTDSRVAPKGELRAALITSIPVLVTRNPEGQLAGVSVDLANALGTKLGIPVRLVPYENIVRYNQSIPKDEWDVGFTPRDLSRIAQLVFSNPFMEVDHSYVARTGITLTTPDEVDRPGIRVAVAQGSAADGYLSRTLKNAKIVRLAGGLVSAREALSFGRVDVYADYTYIAYLVQAEIPGSTVLVEPFDVIRMTIALPKSNAAALPVVNDFISDAKRDGVIAEAIKNANLRGVRPGR